MNFSKEEILVIDQEKSKNKRETEPVYLIIHLKVNKLNYFLPLVNFGVSGGILEANANKIIKYRAQITLSAAIPAAKTDGETPRAFEIAT